MKRYLEKDFWIHKVRERCPFLTEKEIEMQVKDFLEIYEELYANTMDEKLEYIISEHILSYSEYSIKYLQAKIVIDKDFIEMMRIECYDEEEFEYLRKMFEKMFVLAPDVFKVYIEQVLFDLVEEFKNNENDEEEIVFWNIPEIINTDYKNKEKLKREIGFYLSSIKNVNSLFTPEWIDRGFGGFFVINNIKTKISLYKATLRKKVKSSNKKELEIIQREGWHLVDVDDISGVYTYEKEYFFRFDNKPTELKDYEIVEKVECTLVEAELMDDPYYVDEPSPLMVRMIFPTANFDFDNVNNILKEGMRIKISGILRNLFNKKKNEGMFIVEVTGIRSNDISDIKNHEISTENKEKIFELVSKSKEEILDFIDRNLAPKIKRRKWEKFAVVLSAVGPNYNKKGKSAIHILFFGNPETGKSQIAMDLEEIFPLSKVISATSVTEPGLVGSVQQSKNTGIYFYTPGDLIMYNKGVLILDEFDKVKNKDVQNVLHTAMDPGMVSVSKATIKAKTRIHTSLLLIANPKKGRLGINGNTIEEDLASVFDPSILSRIDLIFIFNDDDLTDDDLIEIVKSHFYDPDQEERERMEKEREILRDWIILAKNLYVELDKEVSDYIVERLKELIKDKVFGKTFIKRRLIGFRNVIEAIAKLHLRTKITKEDVDLAIELYRYAMKNFSPSETLEETGVPERKLEKAEVIYEALEETVGDEGHFNSISIKASKEFKKKLKEKIEEYKFDFNEDEIIKEFDEIIDFLEEKGFIEIKKNTIRFIQEPFTMLPEELKEKYKKKPPPVKN